MTVFDCVSPLEFRYYGVNDKLIQAYAPYVTERARLIYEAKVEAAAVRVLARRGICPPEVAEEIATACERLRVEDVAAEEARIHHNIRAMVNCIQGDVSEAARPFVHFTLTSFDVIDTAIAARFKDCAREALIPTLVGLERVLIDLALREKGRVQVGRTHGQHAVPITFGFAVAQHVARLGERIEAIAASAVNLRGKISGAVGAYNASSLLIDDPVAFEREVLAELGVEPSPISTQVVAAEYITDFMHALVSCFSVVADLADDMRHLQRTEIGEVGEEFTSEQVGSSTMPHKRNPWNFENVKSLYKVFMPRMVTVYLDQLSEHQRDLSNSASNRFLPEIIIGLASSVERMTRIMSKLVVDEGNMDANLNRTAGMVAAEPLYILLAAQGHPDAHEVVRRLTLKAQVDGTPVWRHAEADADLAPYIAKLTDDQLRALRDPRAYIGRAVEKTEAICEEYARKLRLA